MIIVYFLALHYSSIEILKFFKVMIVAIFLTFLFKKDTDTTNFENNFGEMESRTENLMPANLGECICFQMICSVFEIYINI
jgi:hypothetical protein